MMTRGRGTGGSGDEHQGSRTISPPPSAVKYKRAGSLRSVATGGVGVAAAALQVFALLRLPAAAATRSPPTPPCGRGDAGTRAPLSRAPRTVGGTGRETRDVGVRRCGGNEARMFGGRWKRSDEKRRRAGARRSPRPASVLLLYRFLYNSYVYIGWGFPKIRVRVLARSIRSVSISAVG